MNQLHVGFACNIELPKSGLFINDEIPKIPRSRIFDIEKHCFNPLQNIDYRKARQIADVLYTTTPQGENTLTVRNGRRALLRALLEAERLDKIDGDEEVMGMIDDILISPVLRRILCNPTNFSFNPNSLILVRLNRAELGDFDALVLCLLLMSHFQGQIIIPDFGFYGRLAHISLIRQDRLIAGVNTLSELEPRLRHNILLIKDKVASGATSDDADTLARYAMLVPNTNAYRDFVTEAMA